MADKIWLPSFSSEPPTREQGEYWYARAQNAEAERDNACEEARSLRARCERLAAALQEALRWLDGQHDGGFIFPLQRFLKSQLEKHDG
jgi:hypothetical protein